MQNYLRIQKLFQYYSVKNKMMEVTFRQFFIASISSAIVGYRKFLWGLEHSGHPCTTWKFFAWNKTANARVKLKLDNNNYQNTPWTVRITPEVSSWAKFRVFMVSLQAPVLQNFYPDFGIIVDYIAHVTQQTRRLHFQFFTCSLFAIQIQINIWSKNN